MSEVRFCVRTMSEKSRRVANPQMRFLYLLFISYFRS